MAEIGLSELRDAMHELEGSYECDIKRLTRKVEGLADENKELLIAKNKSERTLARLESRFTDLESQVKQLMQQNATPKAHSQFKTLLFNPKAKSNMLKPQEVADFEARMTAALGTYDSGSLSD